MDIRLLRTVCSGIALAILLAASANGAVVRRAAPLAFTPTQIANLQAWFDPSQAAGVNRSGTAVTSLVDLSGHGNSVSQATAAAQPAFVSTGINNLGSLSFDGKRYLVGANAAFSANLFNESTVFVVTNQTNGTQSSSVVWSGAYLANPRYNLSLSTKGATNFDFNSSSVGRLAPKDVPNGAALWSAGGSISKKTQFVRKDGNTLSTGTSSGKTVTGNFPLAIGATYGTSAVSYKYSGQLGEALFFNRALTATETTQVEGYLACKWGLQNRLPANHPYRFVCPQGGTFPSLPLPGGGAGTLSDPLQLRSANKQLTFNVVASQASNGNPQLTYNGSTVPPTLRLLPGDTLYVNLTNNLPKPPAGAAYLNDTSLHYHGLHVNPNSPGDDSIDMLAMPGQVLHYTIAIPSTHPSGLYWYHSHAHGEAERQNLAGMSGALIVDGIAGSTPQVANLSERVLIARDTMPAGKPLPAADKLQVKAMLWAMRRGRTANARAGRSAISMPGMSMRGSMSMDSIVRGSSTSQTRNPFVDVNPAYRRFVRPAASGHCIDGSPEAASRNWTLNGQTQPSIGIRPGEPQFWRFVNAGSDTYLDLQVDNTTMQIVGLDGVPLASVGNAPMTVTHYLVPPASRLEFIITGPPSGTTAYLRTNCFDSGSAGLSMIGTTLATIDSTTSPSDQLKHRDRVLPAAAFRSSQMHVHGAAYIRTFLRTHAIARSQTLTYSSQDQINGGSYDPAAPPQFYAQSGTMEQWQIVNVSSEVHTFHIHQIHFLVQSITGGTAIEQSNVGQELDNINVPAANANGPGIVTLVMDFTDPSIVGTFLLHCHILLHEDMGMMAKIHVGTAPPLQTNAADQGLVFDSTSSPAQTVTVSGGKAPYSLSGCAGVATASVSGATVTVQPVGGGGCVLVIADASGLTASVSIAVKAAASPVTVTPASLAFDTPTSAAQIATVSGGSAPYSVAGCTNVVTVAIQTSMLKVTPSAVGSCSLTVTDSANNTRGVPVSVNAADGDDAADILTFHNNNARQGWNQTESTLTTSNVNAGSFGKLAFLPVSGKVFAQPLYVSNETVGGTTHDLVLVASAQDQVYAYDDKTLATVWHRSFTNTGSGITAQSWSATGCNNVNPDIGIVGTPVIDRKLDRLYVVIHTTENGVYHMRLHAISLQNGADVVTAPEVSASVLYAGGRGTATTSALRNMNRSALLEANGAIYVGLGTHCDGAAGSTHGWMLAYNATTLAPVGSLINLTNGPSNGYLGATWMSGYGPAADSSGNIYFATGNGPWDGVNNFSMSEIKVPGNLDISAGSYFTPYDEAALSDADQDLASAGLLLFPDGLSPTYPHLLVQGGKNFQKYILNRDKLGGRQANDAGALWTGSISGGYGGPAYFRDSSGKPFVLYGNGTLTKYLFDTASATLSAANSVNVSGGCLECRDGGSQPIVSSDGTAPGTAIVWALQTPRSAGGTISLMAFDGLTMAPLYTGVAGTWTVGAGAANIGGALISPLVADGKAWVPTDGGVAVFGLK